MKRIVLVGGGSGGHFYPLIAVAEKLQEYNAKGVTLELFYMGPHPYNMKELQASAITFVSCPSGKHRKYFSLLNYLDIFVVFYGFFVALYKLYVLYPDVIFSKGSYTSVPVTLAAFVLRIPVVIHESDTKPGSANKLASKFARYIAISFGEVAQYFPEGKTAQTGIPLRSAFMQSVVNPRVQLGITSEKPLIFITGGSLGSVRINTLILESLDELLPHFAILHQTGALQEHTVTQTAATLIDNSELLSRYFIKGDLSGNEMSLALQAATIVISRAGTGSIFEIAHFGKPALLIPIPEAISHDQKTNAYAYAKTGAATVLEESNLYDGLLVSEINRIISNESVYQEMSRAATSFSVLDARTRISETLLGIAQEHR